MGAEPESVGEQVEGALTGRVERRQRSTNYFLAFMAFIFGLGIGLVLGIFIAYLVVNWAATYDQAPLPPRTPLHYPTREATPVVEVASLR